MNDRDPVSGATDVPVEPPVRAYEKPAIAWVQETEIRANFASACGQIAGQSPDCDNNPGS